MSAAWSPPGGTAAMISRRFDSPTGSSRISRVPIRQPARRPLRPLDQRHPIRRFQILVEAEAVQVCFPGQSVEVNVVEATRCAPGRPRLVLIDQREGRTLHRVGDPEPAGDALRQRRLARPEITVEKHDVARSEPPPRRAPISRVCSAPDVTRSMPVRACRPTFRSHHVSPFPPPTPRFSPGPVRSGCGRSPIVHRIVGQVAGSRRIASPRPWIGPMLRDPRTAPTLPEPSIFAPVPSSYSSVVGSPRNNVLSPCGEARGAATDAGAAEPTDVRV